MTDKTTLLRAFNTHMFEFLEDIINILPNNIGLVTTKNAFELYKKANPTLLIKIWYSYVYQPYAKIIDEGNLDFFIDKDYSTEVSNLSNSDKVLNAIESLRGQIRDMSEINRNHSLQYIQNLCKLSNMYNTSSN
jgi:hypothetical protein